MSYWDTYYVSGLAPKYPSDFAKFAAKYVEPGKKLIDLGCGNGRDSVYFCGMGLKVTAIDMSASAIESIGKDLPILAVRDDFVSAKALFCHDFDYAYARFTVHAIDRTGQDELFKNVYNALIDDGYFFIEVRTVNDRKYGLGDKVGENEYFFDGHYRRFIKPDELIEQLEREGFSVIFSEESDTFSVVGGDAPALLRVVARKSH
jgi:cyclopropane fatty-acyl-phospholipid synthase-like methyltransferase